MEPLAAIGLVGNIVQFVDFSSKILSKTQQLYRSADGAISENVDTELVTNDLAKLTAELQASSSSSGDPALEKLCKACQDVAKELLDALGKLKVDGRKGKWGSVRKALRTVWSKEEIDGIQKRLSSFRDEINLHIVVDLRGRIDLLSLQQSDRFDLLDENSKAVIDAVMNSRDVFEHFLVVQVEELLKAQEQTETTVREMHEQTDIILREEHAATRTEILDEVHLGHAENREAHEIITQEIEQIKQALDQLREEIRQRDEEHKALLTEFSKANTSKKRKALQERSNAITVTIYALQTFYRSLQELLASLQTRARRALGTLRINQIWRVTAYPTPTPHLAPSVYHAPSADDMVLCYYSYYYIPEFWHNMKFRYDMHKKWQIPHDAQITAAGESSQSPLNGPQLISLVNKIRTKDNTAYRFVWSMAVLAAVIVEYVPSGINQFYMASQVLACTRNGTIMSHSSALGTRLQLDLEVWKSIAQVTGLQEEISRLIMARPWENEIGVSPWRFGTKPLEQAEMEEMARFLRWIWFKTEPAEGDNQTQIFEIRYKAVLVVAYSMEKFLPHIGVYGDFRNLGTNWILTDPDLDPYCRAFNLLPNSSDAMDNFYYPVWLPLDSPHSR